MFNRLSKAYYYVRVTAVLRCKPAIYIDTFREAVMLLSINHTCDDVDPREATIEVIRVCKEQLGAEKAQAGLLFTSYIGTDYHRMLRLINDAFDDIKLIGCTTDSEMSSAMGFSEDSVSLTLFSSDEIEFATAVATNIQDNSEASFKDAFSACSAQLEQKPVCGLVFPDGLTSIGIPLDKIIRTSFGELFPFLGGTAGDHYELKQTYQFFGTEVYSDAAPILLFAGPLELSYRIVSGWSPIGNYATVDKFEGNRVYKIGGVTAQQFYERYFGPYQQAFTDFPLALYREEEEDFVLRTPLGVDEKDGSMVFIGNFFRDSKVRLTTILREDAIEAADRANRELLEEIDGRADVVLSFSCAVRRHFLGSRSFEESKRLRDNLEVPFSGFYSYGEIGPFGMGKPTRFHTNTYLALAMRTPHS